MRRALSLGILVCLLFSSLPLFFDDVNQIGDVGSEITGEQSEVNELTEAQKESLKASGLGRAASSTWSATGGSANVDEIYEMVFDASGNVIVCGTIYQNSQFGTTLVVTQGQGDILIAKLSKDGSWLWAVSAGAALFYDECRGVTIDSRVTFTELDISMEQLVLDLLKSPQLDLMDGLPESTTPVNLIGL